MNTLKITSALLGVLGAGALAIAGNAGADVTRKPVAIAKPSGPIVAQPIKTCGNVEPAKTQTLGPGAVSVEATSTTNYGVAGCDSFVVDTSVTADSKPTGKYFPAFGWSHEPGGPIGTPDKAKCESAVVGVQYFKKLHGATTFTKIGGGTIKGKWNAGQQFPCSMSSEAGFQNPPKEFNLPAAGKTDVYRIAISSKELNQKKVVKAGLAHKPHPPA